MAESDSCLRWQMTLLRCSQRSLRFTIWMSHSLFYILASVNILVLACAAVVPLMYMCCLYAVVLCASPTSTDTTSQHVECRPAFDRVAASDSDACSWGDCSDEKEAPSTETCTMCPSGSDNQQLDDVDAPQRHFFCAANDAYDPSTYPDWYSWATALHAPIKDAELLSERFTRIDYICHPIVANAKAADFKLRFDTYLNSFTPNTHSVIVSLAGHGFRRDGQLVFLPVDVPAEIRVDDLVDQMHSRLDELRSGAPHDALVHEAYVLFLCDLCRCGPQDHPALQGWCSVLRPVPLPTQPSSSSHHHAVLYSCLSSGASGACPAVAHGHGAFAEAVGELLGVPLTLAELHELVNGRVRSNTSRGLAVELCQNFAGFGQRYDFFVDEEAWFKLRSWSLRIRRASEGGGRLRPIWDVPLSSVIAHRDAELQEAMEGQRHFVAEARVQWQLRRAIARDGAALDVQECPEGEASAAQWEARAAALARRVAEAEARARAAEERQCAVEAEKSQLTAQAHFAEQAKRVGYMLAYWFYLRGRPPSRGSQ
eukprot:CAMPEP_0180435034 /NCGR_PEP_ID=MMETSP1036_2-20121128/10268_1 /TAXON_ID=632150 /ORGANISM="Azadinium spinosum, Strain 3D9" /LENGTH=539 /DNA_ID=CAMNT_0022440937 /DNA_START=26 /DNA_END=1645 /DNA_ORIENTATION=-